MAASNQPLPVSQRELPSHRTSSDSPSTRAAASKKPSAPRIPVHQIYALPAPIRTFPLPSFYPSNPLSLAHLIYIWLKQTVFARPPNEPSKLYQGEWSPETRSVKISDVEAIRALWEQGFFGKGSLSRSEPNWLKREMNRRGVDSVSVAEQNTNKRREERLRAKWERARLEQELIEQTRLEESLAAAVLPASYVPQAIVPPVGPLELLRLPNSASDLEVPPSIPSSTSGLATGTSGASCDVATLAEQSQVNGSAHPSSHKIEGLHHLLKKQKNVRFSGGVASTTFDQNEPPSPRGSQSQLLEDYLKPSPVQKGQGNDISHRTPLDETRNLEHLQLSAQEAFYLSFAIGALAVVDPKTQAIMSNLELLHLFADHYYFPPRLPSHASSGLRTDDPFLVHYVVYHHFRSLGWVPREGVKFGVDLLLYRRGPVFDHAEFGLVVLPSYSHPDWNLEERKHPQQHLSWFWLHGIQRVLSHVLKSLVLVYVDIPPPSTVDLVSDPNKGIVGLLERYKVREVMVRRWSSNRNR
ncbi:hypothetical protein MCOR07_002358 [Pyricularia oryzae]|uniref:tRNA-intron lyase n=1 Tax=Pyricularia grisea TaxID=148305 RepID=A0ABQ8NM81_PYRGI|nr:hypothetical protein MCOR01_005738 [Pyricularia oryzae]KAI6298763.1 hypothetical protein MCOR33_005210 [Pyricularia grisea]KAI6253710.1 hypothetical protein MCOR19_009745 [Pyricularia oryzae]KAI6309908.1 hypothetical protein MCOR29_008787 [Pyricularia oryzae]KAI6311746.1 hypothetical protein MCOR30_010761 [Pyricularia oryzae]